MKNSNKWLLAALLVLLASLTAYNMALRTEYRRGTYRDPLRDYTTLGFRDFTEVAAPAASVVGLKIVAGPFRVRISPRAAKYVHLRQQGGRLVVTAAFPDDRVPLGQESVVISCPRLTHLSTNAEYGAKGKLRRDRTEMFYGVSPVVVKGFTQDSLSVQQDNATRIELQDNNLDFLRAVAGNTPGSRGTLQLNQGNRVAAASFAIGHQCELQLHDVLIPRLRYHFADSARATFTGAALTSLQQ